MRSNRGQTPTAPRVLRTIDSSPWPRDCSSAGMSVIAGMPVIAGMSVIAGRLVADGDNLASGSEVELAGGDGRC